MSDEKPKNILVHSKEWQKVRKSLLGQWKIRPEWCCDQLRRYLGYTLQRTHKEKIKVVYNYLRGSGFRIGKISHVCIAALRLQLSSEIKRRKAMDQW